MKITIKDVLDVCKGILICGNDSIICNNFSKDTRTIKKDDIYVGIKGDKFNGNSFYKEAFKNGAGACILDDKGAIDENIGTIVLVENSIKALQQLANYKRNKLDIPVIAVTGSVGKTSTKDIIASVLEQKYKVLKADGSYNNHIGLPLTILKYTNEDIMLLEMGMNNFGEISLLTNIAKPTIALITNIGTAHIGILGSRENILKAKLEILEGINHKGILIINNDNDLLHEYYESGKCPNKILTIGIDFDSDYRAFNINDLCNEFNINKTKNIKIPYGTKPFIYNSLFGYAIGSFFNIDEQSIKKALLNYKLSDNRLDLFKNKEGIMVIDDTFNANYDSMKTAIEYLKNQTAKRKIAILGDMLELGDFAVEIHRNIGCEIVKNKIDILITVGEVSANINEEAINKGFKIKNSYHFNSNTELKEFLKDFLQKDDMVLIKASKKMLFPEIVEFLK